MRGWSATDLARLGVGAAKKAAKVTRAVAGPGRAAKAPKLGLRQQTESQLQQQIIRWWQWEARARALAEPSLMAFPLQGARTKRNGARLKAEGMRAGTPDMFLALARGPYHGLWIELKRQDGRLSKTQMQMLNMLDGCGYAAFSCYGLEEAQRLICRYLDGEEFF